MMLAMAAPGWAQRSGARGAGIGARGGVGFRSPSLTIRVAPRPNGILGAPLNPVFTPVHGVPGLGFNYQHLLAVGAAQRRGFDNGRERGAFITPIFWGGWPYFFPYDYSYLDANPYDSAPQAYAAPVQSGQPIVIQVPQTLPPPTDESAPSASYSPQRDSTIPDLQHLVLVKHDGQMLQAVAFIVSGDQVTYVTPEGMRRSFPLADLDKDATREMNEANGNTVSLPG